mmetsp:Transcript_13277/g.29521  ORF Transcript_13277/g.29521 Transcript_13277/m.29521 type:complete len:214 (-) Transcript_13277:1565-2206(-)
MPATPRWLGPCSAWRPPAAPRPLLPESGNRHCHLAGSTPTSAQKKVPPQRTLAHHNTPVRHGKRQLDPSMPAHPAVPARHPAGLDPVQQGCSQRPTSPANLLELLVAQRAPPSHRQLQATTAPDQAVSDCTGRHQHHGPPCSPRPGTATAHRAGAQEVQTLQQQQPLDWRSATATAPAQRRADLGTASLHQGAQPPPAQLQSEPHPALNRAEP